MLQKILLISIFLTSPAFAEFGVKGFGCFNDAGFGGGGGVFYQCPINDDRIKFCPGLDLTQFSRMFSEVEKKCIEMDINFDVKGSLRFKVVEPFFGLGFTPIACWASKTSEADTSYKNLSGAQIFLGCDFPIWKKISVLTEARIKFLSDFNLFKFSMGFLF